MGCLYMSRGTPLLNALTPKIQAQVQQQATNQEVSTILQKLNGLNPKSIEAFLQNSQSELRNYGLAIKEAFANPTKFNKLKCDKTVLGSYKYTWI